MSYVRYFKIFIFLGISLLFLSPIFQEAAFTKEKETEIQSIGYYSAKIIWRTDEGATSQVEYGTRESEYEHVTPIDKNLVSFHEVILSDLTPSTLYHYRVISKDKFGNKSVSKDFTFKTLDKSIADETSPKISNVTVSEILRHFVPQDDKSPKGPFVISDEDIDKIVAAGAPMRYHLKVTKKDKIIHLAKAEEAELTQTGGQVVKEEEPIKKALIQKGGILLKKGKWQIQPTTTYAHTSANRVSIGGYTILPVLVIGEISTEEVKRDIFIETLTTRYGLRNDLQVELSVPYRYQYERISVESPASESTRDLHGIGDISGGVFYQYAYEDGIIPDAIVGLSVKSKTGKEPYGTDIGLGTGHWGIKGSIVAVKSSDPAILFASLGYTHNVKRDDIENYGTIEPGDSFDYSIGTAFALNYQVALSMQLQQSISHKMRLNQSTVPGSFSNTVSLKYGLTWSISKYLSCEVSAAHGLTADSADLVLEVRIPYSF